MDAAKVLRGEMDVKDLDFVLPGDGRIWGSRYPRPTAVGKVTGTLDYGADLILKMPKKTLHAALVQAKVSHANIKGIDTSEAEDARSLQDCHPQGYQGKNRITGLITFPTNKGDGGDRPIRATRRFSSTVTQWPSSAPTATGNAAAAAEKVKLDLEVLPAYMSALPPWRRMPSKSLQHTKRVFHPEIKKGGYGPHLRPFRRGHRGGRLNGAGSRTCHRA